VPVEVNRLRQIDQIPSAVALLLAVLALVAVAHAVITAVRRRRGELAVLKVLGFTRGEVRATVAWQASIIAAVGLVVGVPLGVLLGRGVWRLVADGLGIVPVITNPVLWMVLMIPVVLLLVNLIAFLPARSAARTRPAVPLRSP
jgi:ABC-type lipoprotein release transport system permease subunit